MSQFQVIRKKFTEGRIVETNAIEQGDLADGDIIVKVDKFAYTSNNITYAVAGDMIGYWQFFPPVGEDTADWGVIPVWGFADVTQSAHPDIPIGDRLYGYFPPATHLHIKATKVSTGRVIDGAEHRAALPAPYNAYRRVLAQTTYDKAMDDIWMLLMPLHLTSFCLWDALVDANWHGAEQVIILSASSKTSLGLAYALQQDENSPKVIGLTSARNKEKLVGMKMYDDVLVYDDIAKIPNAASVLVDMSGNLKVLQNIFDELNDRFKYCINVGLTHWKDGGQSTGELSKRSSFFFAPGHIQKRVKEWGRDEFEKRSGTFLMSSLMHAKNWLAIEKIEGLSELQKIHSDVCMGKIPADKGLVVQM